MSFKSFSINRLMDAVIIASLLSYDYFFDRSATISLALSLDFSNFFKFFNLSLLIIYFIWILARIICTLSHEIGHKMSIFGFGELKINWKKILIPFWPGESELGSVTTATNSRIAKFFLDLWKPILDIAGIAINLVTAYFIFVLFKNYDLANYFHVFIFLLGLESLKSAYINIMSSSENADFTHFFANFKINVYAKTIVAAIISIGILIFFKNYYINPFIELVQLISQNNFYFDLILPK